MACWMQTKGSFCFSSNSDCDTDQETDRLLGSQRTMNQSSGGAHRQAPSSSMDGNVNHSSGTSSSGSSANGVGGGVGGVTTLHHRIIQHPVATVGNSSVNNNASASGTFYDDKVSSILV